MTNTNQIAGQTTASDIVVPTTTPSALPKPVARSSAAAPEPTDGQIDAAFREMDAFKFRCGEKANKHDVVDGLIEICIGSGITQGARIRGSVCHYGFSGKHVGLMLSKGTGSNPARYRWSKDDHGQYQLNDLPSSEARVTALDVVI